MSLNPLEQLNAVTVVAVVLLFLATFFVLRRWLFLPLLAVMERRAHKLEAAAAARAEARAVVEGAARDAAGIVAEATAAAERLEREVEDELLRRREPSLAEARARAQESAARGREELSRLRAAEDARLEEQLLACSRQALLKLGCEVDDTALRVLVRRVVAGREAAHR